MVPPYRIVTPRLELRCWAPGDAPALNALIARNLEHLRPYMPWAHFEPVSLDEKVAMLRKFRARFDLDEDYVYGVFLDGQPIGGSGLHKRQGPGSLEIGYWIAGDQVRKGFATELAAALTRVAFDLHKVDRVEIRVEPGNVASSRVPLRLGYQLEAVLRRRLEGRPGQDPRDCEIYTLFATDPHPELAIEAFGPLGEQLLS